MKRSLPQKKIPNSRMARSQARFKPSKSLEGRKKKAGFFIALLLLTALGTTVGTLFGFQYLKDWDTLHVERIEMDGLNRVKPDEVHLYLSHVKGQPMMDIHPHELEKRMVEHPWVKWAKIERSFPNVLKVRVVEHTPRAILSARKLYILDTQGVPFKALEAEDVIDLPIITGIAEVSSEVERQLVQTKIDLAFKAQTAFEKIENQLLGKLNEVQIEPVVGVSLRTSKGIEAIIGHKLFEEKMVKLKELVEHLSEQDRFSSTFLLTDDQISDRVTVRLKNKSRVASKEK